MHFCPCARRRYSLTCPSPRSARTSKPGFCPRSKPAHRIGCCFDGPTCFCSPRSMETTCSRARCAVARSISSRRCWSQVVGVNSFVRSTPTRLRPPHAHSRNRGALFKSRDRVALDRYLFIDIQGLIHDLAPRVDAYAEGLMRIEEQEGLLGGEAIFKGTRLSVRHIGRMHHDGERIDDIIADYPYLRPSDVEFAALFFRANPTLGRPPASSRGERAGGLAS